MIMNGGPLWIATRAKPGPGLKNVIISYLSNLLAKFYLIYNSAYIVEYLNNLHTLRKAKRDCFLRITNSF